MIRQWLRRKRGGVLVRRHGYFSLPTSAPIEVRLKLSNRVLSLLRPRLATAWLDTTEPADGWPPQLERQVTVAVTRCRAGFGSSVAARRGTGPTTVLLNPADDGDFDLLHALAPFSPRVEVMSRDGQLVYAATPARFVLRLSDEERTKLTGSDLSSTDLSSTDLSAAGFDRAELEPVAALNRQLEANSRFPRVIVWLLALLVWGPWHLIGAAERLIGEPTRHDLLRELVNPWFLLQVGLGIVITTAGWQPVRHAARRIRQQRRLGRRQPEIS